MPCTHEEADTRIMIHCKATVIRTVDFDVVTIAETMHDSIVGKEFWIAYGTGKKFRYIPIHEIVNALDQPRQDALHSSIQSNDVIRSLILAGMERRWCMLSQKLSCPWA
jgi:hypothetical protein